jgi:hypothetical protein
MWSTQHFDERAVGESAPWMGDNPGLPVSLSLGPQPDRVEAVHLDDGCLLGGRQPEESGARWSCGKRGMEPFRVVLDDVDGAHFSTVLDDSGLDSLAFDNAVAISCEEAFDSCGDRTMKETGRRDERLAKLADVTRPDLRCRVDEALSVFSIVRLSKVIDVNDRRKAEALGERLRERGLSDAGATPDHDDRHACRMPGRKPLQLAQTARSVRGRSITRAGRRRPRWRGNP